MRVTVAPGPIALSTSACAGTNVFDDTVVEKENTEPAIPRPE